MDALPPIPLGSTSPTDEVKATGTDGEKMVPPVVPRGAQNGAQQPASETLQVSSNCTTSDCQDDGNDDEAEDECSGKNRGLGDNSPVVTSGCGDDTMSPSPSGSVYGSGDRPGLQIVCAILATSIIGTNIP